jgi:HEAT repeat protein
VTELDQAFQALDSPDPAVRADAVRTLGTGGDAAQVGPAISRLLADADELVRSEAVDVLGVLGYVPALDAVRALLRTDRSSLVRAAAAETLGDLGHPTAIVELVGALDDEDAAVRGYAANALGLLGGPEVLPLLDLRLGVESAPTVRAELHGGRYRLGASGALAELLGLLDTMDCDLGGNVLNVWDDLTLRRHPPTLENDAPAIAAALTRVAHRLPELRSHAEALATRINP